MVTDLFPKQAVCGQYVGGDETGSRLCQPALNAHSRLIVPCYWLRRTWICSSDRFATGLTVDRFAARSDAMWAKSWTLHGACQGVRAHWDRPRPRRTSAGAVLRAEILFAETVAALDQFLEPLGNRAAGPPSTMSCWKLVVTLTYSWG